MIETLGLPDRTLRHLDKLERLESEKAIVAQYLIRGGWKRVFICLFLFDELPYCIYVWPEPGGTYRYQGYKQRWALSLFERGTVLCGEWLPKRKQVLLEASLELGKMFHTLFTPDPVLDPFPIELKSKCELHHLVAWWARRHEESYASDINGIIFNDKWVITEESKWILKGGGKGGEGRGEGKGGEEKLRFEAGTQDGEIKYIRVKRGDKPDVWWCGSEEQLLFIDTLALSKWMLQHADKGSFKCQWIAKIKKWKPLMEH